MQPTNEQHVEGTHPPSLQPPSSEENVTEEIQASKVGPPAKDKNGVGTPGDADYLPVIPEFGEDLLSDVVTCDVSSYISSVFASSGEWSTTIAVVGAGTT